MWKGMNWMIYKTLNWQKTDHVMIVNIDSHMNDQVKMARLSDELAELFDAITWDGEIQVVVLSDAGEKSFEVNDPPKTTISSFAEPIARLDKPVIAAINGDATGQGMELILACDIRITTRTSRFGFPQIMRGLIPWDGGTQRLSRLVGRGKAIEMILTGEMIDAREAFRIGLVNKVVSPDGLMGETVEMAKLMASKGPIAVRYAKEAIYKGMDLTLDQGLHLEADLYLLLHTTKDRTKGIEAFRGKRTPRFEGK